MPDGLNLLVSGSLHSESLYGAFNRPGSGLGPQQQRPLHVNRWKEWIEQLHRVARAAQRPGVPTYVIGSSWGARPALAAVAGDQRDFAGAILLKPALKTRRDFAFFVQSWFGIAIFLAPNESMRIPLRECDYTPRQATRVGWLRDPRMTTRMTYGYFVQTLSMRCAVNQDLPLIRQPVLALLAMTIRSSCLSA